MPTADKSSGTQTVSQINAQSSIQHGIVLTLCSVGLFALCIPGKPFPWIAWIALVPLNVALRATTPIRGFFLGGFFGWLMWFTSVWWLQSPLHDIAGMSSVAATSFTMAGCLLMAFPYAIAGATVSLWRGQAGAIKTVRDAAIFTLAITWLTPIFQGSAAHTQYLYPVVLQVLELGGAPFLLFLILWVNFLIAECIFAYRTGRGLAWKTIILTGGIVGSVLVYGLIRLHQFDSAMMSASPEQSIVIGIVQPNIPIPVDRARQPAPNAISNNFFTAMEQARTLVREHPEIDLLALPENPATFVFNQDAARRQALGELVTETGKPIILNVDAIDAGNSDAGGAKRYNVTVLIDTNRNLAARYPKIKRIPFVEYIPGETEFPWLRKWFPKSLRVLEGDGPKIFTVRPGIRVIPLICYEGTISSHTRKFVKLGGNVFLNQANDSWFLRTPASKIHLALTLFRTVEYRVPLVRVTNAGIGAHIQANGRIVSGSQTELFTDAVNAFPLYVPPKRSVYSRIGNYWMIGFVFLLPVERFFRKRMN